MDRQEKRFLAPFPLQRTSTRSTKRLPTPFSVSDRSGTAPIGPGSPQPPQFLSPLGLYIPTGWADNAPYQPERSPAGWR